MEVVSWRHRGLSALLVVCAACGETTFQHGEPTTGRVSDSGPVESSTATTGFGDGGGSFDPQGGNFPTPATTVCGKPPHGEYVLEDLAAAWAVVALPGATDSEGRSVPAGSVRLRLSPWNVSDCTASMLGGEPFSFGSTGFSGDVSGGFGDDSGGLAGSIRDGNGLGVTLLEDEFQIGSVELQALRAPAFEAMSGMMEPYAGGATGSLEIMSISSACVVGVFDDITLDSGEVITGGGFVAQTCTRQCVPGPAQDCG